VRTTSSYLHTLNGRLRIKVAEVKNSPDTAREIESQLRLLNGIEDAQANPVTGNVLVFYDASQTASDEIVDSLHTWGYLRRPEPATAEGGHGSNPWGSLVLRATTEFALQKLITALI
jgi:hypothetical protein